MDQKNFDRAVDDLTYLAEEIQEKTGATDEEMRDILDIVRQNWV